MDCQAKPMVTKILDRVMTLAGHALMRISEADVPNTASVTVATWDACVATISDPALTPDPKLNRLVKFLWTLCNTRTVCTALYPVSALSFMVLDRTQNQNTKKLTGIIAIPENWIRMFAVDPWMQLGAVVHTASKARDFWAGKIGESGPVERRAKAFEAAFLRLAATDESTQAFTPNSYQATLLSLIPQLPENADYEHEPFDLTRARALFEDFSERGIQAPQVSP